jgi:putative DNA primase/helicase
MRAEEDAEGRLEETTLGKADASDDTPEGGTEAHRTRPYYLGNDTGNADRLYAFYGNDLAHCEERNGYMVWNGRYWKYDRFVMSERMAEATMRRAYADAEAIPDADDRRAFLKFVSRSLSKKGLDAMVHLAKKKVRQVSTTDFDRDPFLLNCKNGTVNLRTGEKQNHRKQDLLSKMIPFDYDPAAKCPQFLRFIYRIMGDGPDATPEEQERAARLVPYLQRLFGCAASGKPEKLLVVCYGASGDNGKTTLLTTMSKALGEKEYSTQVNIESLMVDPKGGGISNAVNSDLSDLQGCRYVFSSEVERGQRLALSRVKYITGLTAIKTRRLRENWITFPPTWETFMDCNDRPVISSPTDTIWNRVKCIPFTVKIGPEEIDTDLSAKLEAELPGILAWIVDGARDYAAWGLGPAPAEVEASTEEYKESSDRLKPFIEDCCYLNPNAWVSSERLNEAYIEWCGKNGERYPLDSNNFVAQLKAKKCTAHTNTISGKKVRGWKGIELVGNAKVHPDTPNPSSS